MTLNILDMMQRNWHSWTIVQKGCWLESNKEEVMDALLLAQKSKAQDDEEKNSGNVIPLGMITYLDLPCEVVLENSKQHLDKCVILGWDADDELYFASTFADGGEVAWLLLKAQTALMGVEGN